MSQWVPVPLKYAWMSQWMPIPLKCVDVTVDASPFELCERVSWQMLVPLICVCGCGNLYHLAVSCVLWLWPWFAIWGSTWFGGKNCWQSLPPFLMCMISQLMWVCVTVSVTAVSGAGIAKLVQHHTEKPGAVLMQVLVPSVMIARRPLVKPFRC